MTLLAFAVIVVACVVMVLIHRSTQKRLADAILKQQNQIEEQAVANYKQIKAAAKQVAINDRAGRKLADECRKAIQDAQHFRDDARAIHQHIGAVVGDPRIKRLLDQDSD